MSNETTITLEPRAAEKVAEYRSTQPQAESDVFLRLGVKGGGCSGFKYALALDEKRNDDLEFESEGQKIIVAQEAIGYVQGSRIVWRETLAASGFDVENPNATASCGCGSSFRVDPGATGCSEDALGEAPSDINEDTVY